MYNIPPWQDGRDIIMLPRGAMLNGNRWRAGDLPARPSRAANDPSQSLKFYNHGECPCLDPLLVESTLKMLSHLRHYLRHMKSKHRS